MAKPLILTLDGKAIGAKGNQQVDVVAAPFTATLTKTGIAVVAAQPGWFFVKARFDCEFLFAESSFERIDTGRNVGKAAGLAIAGTLLAGPLGLIAGAALGAGKKHLIAVRCGDDALVVELNNSELQLLAGRGLLSA